MVLSTVYFAIRVALDRLFPEKNPSSRETPRLYFTFSGQRYMKPEEVVVCERFQKILNDAKDLHEVYDPNVTTVHQ